MNIWLLQASEPIPIVNEGERLLRMGMIAEELSKRGHQITWFSNTFDHFKKKQLYKKDTIIKVKENYSIYLSHAIGYKRNISISRMLNHKIIAKKFKNKSKTMEKPDIIYVAFPTIDYAEEAVKYGKKYNVPVIVDVRDLWPDTFKHNMPRWLRCFAYPYISLMNKKTKKIMRDTFSINSISELMLDWGIKKGNRVKSEFDRCFYIGYDKREDIKYSDEEIKQLIDTNKFNISFFATINNQFDYKKIVQLAKKLKIIDKEIVINICGDGPKLKSFKEMAQGSPNIKFYGWVNKKQLNIILQNSSIGLAPYKNTFDFQMSVSNKFAEYISYGLPVVLTSEGYMKELVKKNNCGISSHDIEELCNFIIMLKNNPEEYKKNSNNAINLYKNNFVAEEIYTKLADYLERIKEEN